MSERIEAKKLLKVSLFFKKLPEISDEKFHEYWRTTHLKLAMENKIFTDKVRRYNQHHTSAQSKEEAAVFGMPVMEYDGVAELWVDNLDAWKSVLSDPEFVNVLSEDQKNFILVPGSVMLGYDELKIGKEAPQGK